MLEVNEILNMFFIVRGVCDLHAEVFTTSLKCAKSWSSIYVSTTSENNAVV